MIAVQLVNCFAGIPIGDFNSPVEPSRVAFFQRSIHAHAKLIHIGPQFRLFWSMRFGLSRSMLRASGHGDKYRRNTQRRGAIEKAMSDAG